MFCYCRGGCLLSSLANSPSYVDSSDAASVPVARPHHSNSVSCWHSKLYKERVSFHRPKLNNNTTIQLRSTYFVTIILTRYRFRDQLHLQLSSQEPHHSSPELLYYHVFKNCTFKLCNKNSVVTNKPGTVLSKRSQSSLCFFVLTCWNPLWLR